ncbi:hypothetical protein AGMMS50276_01150 [Synergistales bacterium]|nr:hypothetical protein AGMMS50276_01150 [Synergistales bacterium]
MDKYEKIVAMWKQFHVNTSADIDLRLNNFRILFAYNSGKIENEAITYHDTREIFENGRILNFTGDPRAVFEQENQRLCYEFLKDKIAAKETLTVALIKEIHAILTSGTYDERRYIAQGERPGQFKKHDYVIGREEVGSLPEDVESDLHELLDELEEYKDRDILKIASYYHARFEYIHPFADGNGRVGRTSLNYYLMIQDHPPMIIFDEDKAGYYSALEAYDQSESLEAIYKFLRHEIEHTWEKTLERRLLVWGVGNVLMGDDAVGCEVVRLLNEREISATDCGTTPENYISTLKKNPPLTLLIVDAADMGLQPGEFGVITLDKLDAVFESSHGVPLSVLLAPFENSIEITVIGIQPLSLALGAPLSKTVANAARNIANLIVSGEWRAL